MELSALWVQFWDCEPIYEELSQTTKDRCLCEADGLNASLNEPIRAGPGFGLHDSRGCCALEQDVNVTCSFAMPGPPPRSEQIPSRLRRYQCVHVRGVGRGVWAYSGTPPALMMVPVEPPQILLHLNGLKDMKGITIIFLLCLGCMEARFFSTSWSS